MAKEITRHQDLQEQQEATREAQKATPGAAEATKGLNIACAQMISAKSSTLLATPVMSSPPGD
jgi:hypothetical protein